MYINGTARTGEINGSSALELRLLFGLVVPLVWLWRFSSLKIEDLLRLCREVKLSSRGFISGGSFEILLKRKARYVEISNEHVCVAPFTTLIRKVECIILVVLLSKMKRDVQRPALSTGFKYCARDSIAVKTRNEIKPTSTIAANII